MLEKPPIPDEEICTHLVREYRLLTPRIRFLPLGADGNTAVYRVDDGDDDGETYFLKLRKDDFHPIAVLVPDYLHKQGIRQVIQPFPDRTGRLWSELGSYKAVLYPFIEGQDGFTADLSDSLRVELGAALRSIHDVTPPIRLLERIQTETFSSRYRERVRQFLIQAEAGNYREPVAVKLVSFLRETRREILRLIDTTERLLTGLESSSPDFVLCHSDLHGGNLLIGADGSLFIVDWDNPILAPKERDLMFIGAGIDDLWPDEQQIHRFYEGYGRAKVDLTALAYYRCERIVQDLDAFCAALLLTDAGGADRERSFRFLASNFAPGGVIEIAYRTALQAGTQYSVSRNDR